MTQYARWKKSKEAVLTMTENGFAANTANNDTLTRRKTHKYGIHVGLHDAWRRMGLDCNEPAWACIRGRRVAHIQLHLLVGIHENC